MQREDEKVAGILEVVEFRGIQVSAARLHCDVLLCSDHVGDWRALQRGAYVEPPQFL